MSHRDADGLSPGDRVTKFYPGIIGGVGENIASNYGDTEKKVAENLMKAWMKSPGHRANILKSAYNIIGVGVYKKERYFYATQLFMDAVVKIPEDTVREYKYDEEAVIRFEYTGSFDKEKLTVFCKYPDRSAQYFLPDGRYYTGSGPVTPKWIDDKFFTVNFKFNKGKGIYKFLFGKKGRLYPDGFRVVVK